MFVRCTAAGAATILGAVLSLSAGPLDDALSANRISGGLVVAAGGAADAASLVAAGSSGKYLVHVLVSDNTTLATIRVAVMGAGKYGLVSAEKAEGWTKLPYAADQVNLLVADLDDLGPKGLTRAEIERVLVPSGVAYVKTGGSWTWITKPWDANMGDLTHWFANAQGTSITEDKRVAPPTALRWVVGSKHQAAMRMESNTGMRAAKGVVSYSHKLDPMDKGVGPGMHLVGRDAFNGLMLWEKDDPRKIHDFESESHRYVLADGVLFYFPRLNEHAEAWDAHTGTRKLIFSNGVKLVELPTEQRLRVGGGTGPSLRTQELVYQDNLLVQTGGNRLVVLNATTGAVVWEKTETEGLFFQRPVITPDSKRLFVMLMYTPVDGARWPLGDLKNVIAYDLTNGTQLWRNTEVDETFSWLDRTSRNCAGQMAYSNGYLALFGPEVLADFTDKAQTVIGLNAETGQRLWMKRSPQFVYSMLVKNDTAYTMCGNYLYPFALKDGGGTPDGTDSKGKAVWLSRLGVGYNGRCNRASGTTDYTHWGLGTWHHTDWKWNYLGISRSSCATGAFLGHGQTMYTPNGCGCISQPHRGYQAERYDLPLPVLDDAGRLTEGAAVTGPLSAGQTLSVSGPVVYDWTHNNAEGYILENTDPVSAGGLSLIARVHEHRIDAMEGGSVKWSFVAGGRISMKPEIVGDLAVFGSHDGYVYAVKVSDGTPVWRFMGAPNHKKVLAYGQLESAWPVFGVTVSGSTVAFGAGRHSELDGGIWVYGLDAATGALQWKRQVVTETLVYSAADQAGVSTVMIDPKKVNKENKASLSAMGFDVSNPQNMVLTAAYGYKGRAINLSGPTFPLTDIPMPDPTHVGVSRPSRVSSLLGGAVPRIDLRGLSGRTLMFQVIGRGTHRVRITNAQGREVVRFNPRKGVSQYSVPGRSLGAGLFIIRVDSDKAQQQTRPFRLF